MKIAASSRTVVVALALAGSVGVGAALAASAATAPPDQLALRPASTVGQPANVTPEPTSTTQIAAAARDPHVGLAEASRIAALVGHGRVTESDQETTGAGLSYEMTVVGPNGAVRTVTVDAGTGRVLANTPKDATEAKDTTDAGDPTESADGSDADGDDHAKDQATDRDVKDDDSNDGQATGQEDSSVR